ncbi:MAG: aminoacyl-tRNA hydrolase [Treponema sp.]|jgi:PTH1 family peptidyl-tRNA hydrolase|nr:aminoacyl-tRNA hydrolase [Treponema sp.]
MIRLAVFLGNPGAEYERNRHNAGRLLLRRLPFYGELSWTKKFRGLYASREITGGGFFPPGAEGRGKIHLLQPETYMNLSGESVFPAAAFYRIGPEEIIVVHDELELPPGTVSFKFGGGLGGHNGLRSIKQRFGTADFWRLRIGVGRPAGRKPGEGGRPVKSARDGGPGDIADWVLSAFSAAEQPALDAALDAAAAALLRAFEAGPESLLPEWGKYAVSSEH